MNDKEKLIDFLESSGYKYELCIPEKKEKEHTIKNFIEKEFDEYIKISDGCGYWFFGEFFFLNGKSVNYGFWE